MERVATIVREKRIGSERRFIFVFVLGFLRAVYVCGIISLGSVQQKGVADPHRREERDAAKGRIPGALHSLSPGRNPWEVTGK